MTDTLIVAGSIFILGYMLGVVSGMAVKWHWRDHGKRKTTHTYEEPMEWTSTEPVVRVTRLTSRNHTTEI
jgi:hypothetical protein